MEEDPLLTPRPWWASRRARYPYYRTRSPSRAWLPGFAALGLAALVFPILVLVLTKL